MKEPSIIQVTNFSKNYGNTLVSLRDINVTKRITTLIGDNGCGKSTLLKGIARLIQFDGTVLMSKTCSYMPEKTYFPIDVTLIDFLNCHQLIHNYNQVQQMNLIFLFKLEDKLGAKLNTLSKGMKLKVNLIVTLSQMVEVYLLDEPFTGLDKESVNKLIEYIKKDHKHYVITSHQNAVYDILGGEILSL
jgi:ABC-2 type transport system ATP-binding protein